MGKHVTKICFSAVVILSIFNSVSVALLPDIYVLNWLPGYLTFSPGSAAPGETLSVNWKVCANSAIGIPEMPPPPQFPPAYGPWDDGVYLSSNSTLDPCDILIGSNTYTGTLYAGQQYSTGGQFQIPPGLAEGTYYVILYTDHMHVLSENSETNNYTAAQATLTVDADITEPDPTPVEPVSFWEFNGTANDTLGNNNGSLANGALIGNDPARGQVLSLDGVNDYVLCGNDASADVGAGSFTVAAWVKRPPNNGVYDIIGKRNPTSPYTGWIFEIFTWSDGLGWRLKLWSPQETATQGLYPFEADTWYHVAAVRDAANSTITYYVNGEAISSWPYSNSDLSNSSFLTIGRLSNENLHYFPGSIDDVRLYKGALNADQIAAFGPFEYLEYKKAVTWTTIDYPGGSETMPRGIDGNLIVGSYESPDGTRGFLFDGTNWTSLNYPGAIWSEARGISGNNIVGKYVDEAGAHGFLYDGTNWTTLPIIANAIDGDIVVGDAHFYSRSNGLVSPIWYPGSVNSYANGISGNTIVGEYDWLIEPGYWVAYGFTYNIQTGNWTSVYDLRDSQAGYSAKGIDGGNVVGSMGTMYLTGFVFNDGTWRWLNAPQAMTTWANDISDNKVVGYYNDGSGGHGFVYTFSKADLNQDDAVDFIDYGLLASHWGDSPISSSVDIAPAGGDGVIDFKDVTVLAADWLAN